MKVSDKHKRRGKNMTTSATKLFCVILLYGMSILVLLSTYLTRQGDIKFDFHVRNDYCYVKSSDHCIRNADNILKLVTFRNYSIAMNLE